MRIIILLILILNQEIICDKVSPLITCSCKQHLDKEECELNNCKWVNKKCEKIQCYERQFSDCVEKNLINSVDAVNCFWNREKNSSILKQESKVANQINAESQNKSLVYISQKNVLTITNQINYTHESTSEVTLNMENFEPEEIFSIKSGYPSRQSKTYLTTIDIIQVITEKCVNYKSCTDLKDLPEYDNYEECYKFLCNYSKSCKKCKPFKEKCHTKVNRNECNQHQIQDDKGSLVSYCIWLDEHCDEMQEYPECGKIYDQEECEANKCFWDVTENSCISVTCSNNIKWIEGDKSPPTCSYIYHNGKLTLCRIEHYGSRIDCVEVDGESATREECINSQNTHYWSQQETKCIRCFAWRSLIIQTLIYWIFS